MTFVAIDGPGGAGKSTVARALATRLGVAMLDTGAMYRAVALFALRAGADLGDGAAMTSLAQGVALELADDGRVLADGEDVSAEIRSPAVDAAVSEVAAHPGVRRELVERQRAWAGAHGGGVLEGRDIASVVLPEADLKVFLTASHDVRAERRAAQGASGRRGDALDEVRESIVRRDALDSGRADSPLVVAPGAVVIDSTGRTADEVVEELLGLLEGRGGDDPLDQRAREGGNVAGRAIRPSELAFYAACRVVAVGSSVAAFPGPVSGRGHLPAHGAYILAPVHRSYVDWLVVARVTRRRLRYLVKGEVWKSKAVGRLLELLGAFPVRRGAADREAFDTALGVLLGGEPLVLFPEGTRSSGPVIGELRDGAAYLSLRAGVPIVPVGIAGTERAMPRGRRVPRPGRVRLVVGEPLEPAAFLPPRPDAQRAPSAGGVRVPRSATRGMSRALRDRLQSVYDEAEAELAAARRRRRAGRVRR